MIERAPRRVRVERQRDALKEADNLLAVFDEEKKKLPRVKFPDKLTVSLLRLERALYALR